MTKTATSTALITRDYKGMTFTFREDGYFNMTKAAKHFGKDLKEFWSNISTWNYVESLAKSMKKLGGIPPSLSAQERCQVMLDLFVETKQGRNGGTWAHPKLAIRFARWLSTDFEVWCDAMIEDILTGNAEVTITKPEESAVVQATKNLGDIGVMEALSQFMVASTQETKRLIAKTDALVAKGRQAVPPGVVR